MQTTTLATSLVLVSASLVDIAAAAYTCYYDGQTMTNDHLYYHSKRACEGYDGKRGAFQGTYKPRETTSVCVSVGPNRINMEVGNLNPTASLDVKDSDCTKEFKRIIDQCINGWTGKNRGGKGDNAGWYFRIDPNTGNC